MFVSRVSVKFIVIRLKVNRVYKVLLFIGIKDIL